SSRRRKHGRRRVHVRRADSQDPVRAGSRRLEHRRTQESGSLEDRRRNRAPRARRAEYPGPHMKLTLAFSPCPNDCFMFDAIVNGRIDLGGLEFDVRLADVEALNKATFAGDVDVTKLSYHAYAYCAGAYVLLDAGSALGRNCGPLLISKREIPRAEVAAGGVRIAIPGMLTTANFLCGLAFPQAQDKTPILFSDIEPAVLDGRFDA